MMRRIVLLAACLAALLTGSCARVASAATISHVVVIAMENHSRSQVIGSSSAPYITSLAKTYGQATNYQNLSHPSLPNYLAITGGTLAGTAGSDCDPSASCGSNGASIYSEATWKAYNQSMPSHCYRSDSGEYAVRHNPAVYYRTLTSCPTNDLALASTPSLSRAFTFITPDVCHDMHSNDCAGSGDVVKQGDTWLKGYLPKLMATTQYQAGSTAIFVWWDENSGSGTLPFVVVSPYTHGVSYSGSINHYDTLHTIQSLLGKSCLVNSCGQTNFAAAFGL